MIAFSCQSCGTSFRVPDANAGKKGKCTKCGAIMMIPAPMAPAPAEPEPFGASSLLGDAVRRDLAADGQGIMRPCRACGTPHKPDAIVCDACGVVFQGAPPPDGPPPAPTLARAAQADAAEPIADGPPCPSCRQRVPSAAKICVRCGIKLPSGRPVLTARVGDEDVIEQQIKRTVSPLSWIMPIGIFPLYSEAIGKSRPYATWGIAIFTILVSAWFWSHEWTNSPDMQTHKNLMLWAGDAEPSAEQLLSLYSFTSYGNSEAFWAKFEEL